MPKAEVDTTTAHLRISEYRTRRSAVFEAIMFTRENADAVQTWTKGYLSTFVAEPHLFFRGQNSVLVVAQGDMLVDTRLVDGTWTVMSKTLFDEWFQVVGMPTTHAQQSRTTSSG